MYKDNIKLFAKNERELKTLIQTVGLYHYDIGIEFCFEKRDILITEKGKRQITEGIELLNQERIRTLGNLETYKHLGRLKPDIKKQVEKEEKAFKNGISDERKSVVAGISSKG